MLNDNGQQKISELKRLRDQLPKGIGRQRRLLTRRIYYLLNPGKCRKWERENPDKVKAISRNWYLKNTERNKQRTYRNRRKNPEKTRELVRKWHREHASERLAYRRALRRSSVQFAIADRLRRTMNRALRKVSANKSAGSFALTGCTMEFLKQWIENHFTDGMSWDNRHAWHLDHIIPVAAFDLKDQEEQQWAFNYQNLRPLPAFDNQSKSDTLPSPLPSWLPSHISARILSRRLKSA